RHTRSKRDWSSDVCSSDLGELAGHRRPVLAGAGEHGDDLAAGAFAVDLLGGVEHGRQRRVVAQGDGAGDHPRALGDAELASDLRSRAAHGQVDVDVRVDEFGAFDEGDPASEVVDDGFGGAQDGGGGAPDDLGPGLLDDVRGVEGLDRGHDLRVEAGGQTGEGEPGQRRGVESVGVDDVDVLV